jgi:hypothetical protein
MKRAGNIIGLIALAIFLFWSIGRLFALRFERGDVYPAYSSLRMDPLGAKALADALALMPGVEVRRNYRPLVRLKPAKPVTLVYLGLDYRARFEDEELAEFTRIVEAGSQAVFAFNRELSRAAPQRIGAATPAPGATPAPNASPTPIPSATPAPRTAPTPAPLPWQELTGTPFGDVAKRWNFAFDRAQEEKRAAFHGEAVPAAPEMDETIPWHSALFFKDLGPEWKTLYTCNEKPVVVSRPFGNGTIVLCSDSYFLSNEGLSGDPPGRLLELLFQGRAQIIFDEEHLGVTETPNIAMLARRMRLGGLVFALVVIAILYVWKQSTRLLPRQDDEQTSDEVTGTAANEGFIHLLHRSIAPGSLLETCAAAWLRARGRMVRAEERTHIETILRAHGDRSLKDAPSAYGAIAEGLKSK